jgi:succinate-semialdehyde dehydrogenase/glutarate-semialdehyde dehydrogenase
MEKNTQLGPLATERIRAELHQQVQRSVSAGARVLTGGEPVPGQGFYYAPTVLTDIPPDSPAFKEELFGPVAAVFRARDLNHAIALANLSRYGLGSAAWTNDANEQRRFIEELESGLVFINGMVASDPRLPFGGVKRSGYGRELNEFGIREFVNIKTVVLQAPAQIAGALSE